MSVTADQLAGYILGTGGLLSGLAALRGVRNSRKAGVSSDEREARRDEAAQRRDTLGDRDNLIDRLQRDVERLTTEGAEMRARVDDLEARLEQTHAALEDERTYTRALVDHSYRHGIQPPARPTRSTT
ncbi:MAG: hypothetical protein NVV66_18250 [Cellulomonas sp.]|uniref:hypothetical protein n=1 Tax=Cellulomonas sp. TaxID=40001 RepID=UPI0025903430|nr:hypothetical protein [Cellulomonas sp.]MCR6706539.1 hypothetical protein [Cellulomonas sp.]